MSTHRKGIKIAAHLILWLALGLAFQLTLNPGTVFADPPPGEQFEDNGQPVTAVPQLQQNTTVTPTLQAVITATLSLSAPEIQPGEGVTVTLRLSNIGTAEAAAHTLNLYLDSRLTPLPGSPLTPDTEAGFYTLASGAIAPQASQAWAIPLHLDAGANTYQYLSLSGTTADPQRPQHYQAQAALAVTGATAPDMSESEADKGWLPRFTAPTVSLFSGAATYGYGFDVVPGRRGLQPQLGLGYSSRSTDGILGWVHSGAYGEGWEMSGIPSITRNHVKHASPTNETIEVQNTYSLVFGGGSYLLRKAGHNQEYGLYQAIGEPSLYIERRNELAGNGSGANVTGEYWLIRTGDGTEYRLGHNEDAEQILYYAVGLDGAYIGREANVAAYRWFLDEVRDVYGNGMVITYLDDAADGNLVASQNGCNANGLCREVATYPEKISYNNQTAGVMANWLSTVEFSYISSQYVPVVGGTPIFATMLRLSAVTVKHNEQKVWDYSLNYQQFCGVGEPPPSQCNPYHGNNATVASISTIQQRHYQDDGAPDNTNPLPPVTFTYQELHNGWTCQVVPQPGQECLFKQHYYYPHLTRVENGYGGVYEITYGDVIRNGIKSFFVTDVKAWDGFGSIYPNPTPTVHFDYDYQTADACFDTWTPLPSCFTGPGTPSEKLVGFAVAPLLVRNGSGTVLSRSTSHFITNNNEVLQIGKEVWSGSYHPGNGVTLLSETGKTWTGDDAQCLQDGLLFDFFCLKEEKSIQYFYPQGGGQNTLTTWQHYHYNPDHQGGRQWGKVTQVDTFYKDINGADTLQSRQISKYRTNPTRWVIVPWVSGTYAADYSAAQRTLYLYDGQLDPDDQSINIGKLTMSRATMLTDVDPGSNVAYDTIDTTFAYDPYGSPSSVTTYAGYGRVGYTTSDDWNLNLPAGNGSAPRTSSTLYMNHGLQVQAQRNPLYPAFAQTTFSYHNRFYWLPASVTDANGLVTSYAYDNLARLTTVARPGDSLANPTMQYQYTLPTATVPLKVETIVQPNGGSSLRQETEAFYNGLGQLVQTGQVGVNVAGEGVRDVVALTAYDALGRPTCQSTPFTAGHHSGYQPTAVCANQPHTTTSYNERGAVSQVVYPDNTATTTTYAIPGVWSQAIGRGLQQAYITNAKGDVTVNTYDAFGRLDWVAQKDNGGPCNAAHITLYGYDTVGNLTQVTRDGQVCGSTYTPGNVITSMTYDGAGRKLTMDDPDMGHWDYTYDAAGSLVRQTANLGLPEAQTLCFTYDPLGRLRQKGVGDTQPTCTISEVLATYTYDPPQGAGQLHTVSWGPNPADNYDTFSYDSLGRPYQQTRWLDGTPYTLTTLSFDLLHRPTAVQYPDGETVTTVYDHEGANGLKLGANTWLVDDMTYNARGQMVTFSRPAGLPDTTTSYFGATGTAGNGNFRLSGIQHGSAGDALPNFSYEYDLVGNMAKLTAVTTAATETQQFTYDALNRLKTACTFSGSGCVPNPNLAEGQYHHTYTYDRLGNIDLRTEKEGSQIHTYDYLYNTGAQPHAVTGVVTSSGPDWDFSYDAHGNMKTRLDASGDYGQAFDAENRLSSVTKAGVGTTTFFYDAGGQRVKTVNPDGTILYTPFPGYDEEHQPLSWQPITPGPNAVLAAPADGDRSLATGDAPGWGLSLSQGGAWTPSLLPVAVTDLAANADNTFPATSLYTGAGVGEPYLGGPATAVNNLADGAVQSPPLSLTPGRQYRLRAFVKGQFSGTAAVRVIPYGNTGQTLTPWSATSSSGGISGSWQEVNVTFIMPAYGVGLPPTSRLQLAAGQMGGWVAFDNLRLYEMNDGKPAHGGIGGGETLLYSSGFQPGHGWTNLPHAAFPATSLWTGGSGPAVPQEGSHSLVISNLGQGSSLTSPMTTFANGNPLTVDLKVQRDLANALSGSADGVALMVNYYQNSTFLGSRQLWHSDQLSNNTAWQTVTAVDVPAQRPAGTNRFSLALAGSFYSGWLAVDDVTAKQGTLTLASWDFSTPTWTTQNDNAFPAGTVWYGDVAGLSLPGDIPDPGRGHIYAFSNQARATAVSGTWFDTLPYQSFQVEAWVRGSFAGSVGGGRLWAEFYNGSQFVDKVVVWQAAGHSSPTWTPITTLLTTPYYADRFRLVAEGQQLNGWLALADVTVLDRTQPAPWQVANTWQVAADPALPATATDNSSAVGQPQTGSGRALALGNLGHGALAKDGLLLQPNTTYTLRAWVNASLTAGEVAIEVVPYGSSSQTMTVWTLPAGAAAGWQMASATFTMPANNPLTPSTLRLLTSQPVNGWVAFDEVALYEGQSGLGNPIFADGFETAGTWTELPDAAYPATAVVQTSAGPAAPVAGSASALIGNPGEVTVVSPRVAMAGMENLSFTFDYESHFAVVNGGGLTFTVAYYEDGELLIETHDLWSTQGGPSSEEGVVTVADVAPGGAKELELRWQGRQFHGWAVVDDVSVTNTAESQLLASWDLATPSGTDGWSSQGQTAFPAGAAWWDGARAGGGYRLTNEAGGEAHTALFPATPGQSYHLQSWLRGEMTAAAPAELRLRFLNNGVDNGEQVLWSADELTILAAGQPGGWQTVGGTFTVPPNSTHFQIALDVPRLAGWLALDGMRLADLGEAIPAQANQDYELAALVAGETAAAGQPSAALIVAYYDGAGQAIQADTVWSGVDYHQTPALSQGGGFRTPPGTASLRLGVAASVDNDVQPGWLLFDRVALTALSQPITVAAGQSLTLSALVAGELDGPGTAVSGRLAAHYYDSQGSLLAVAPIWQATDYNAPTTPVLHSGSASHAAATQVRVGLMTVVDEGWLAFDTIKLSSLSEAITARSGQEHKVTAVVSGELAAAGSARLFVKHSSGSVVTLWQDGGGGAGIGSIDAPFTTPAGVSSFQVGTEVVLDEGWLAFNDLTLTAYSDPLPVTAGGQYQALAQVTGAVTAGVGQGGRILAMYKSGSGLSAGSDVLWRNPLNFSGTAVVQDTFSANTGAATMQLALESDLDAGHLAFSDLGLQHLTASDVIRRSTYSVGGQATAVKVQGDPDATKNGIFFLYSDHLGSTSVMSYGYHLNGSLHPQAGQKVEGSEARYLPFGGWRGTTPTAGLTDRGYTGHKSNNLGTNDIGLIYMNARFYAPGAARFLSADTIVPDAANPQSYNRYSYVYNNPLSFTDPSGHCATSDEGCWSYLENAFCQSICDNWSEWITLSIGQTWTIKELSLVREALLATKTSLQSIGIDDWKSTMTPLTFINTSGRFEHELNAFFGEINGSYFIGLYEGILNEVNEITAVFTILHEIGHAIDHNKAWGDDDDLSWLGWLLGYNTLTPHVGFEAGRNCMRDYACSDDGEAWADSFAMFATAKGCPLSICLERDMEWIVNDGVSFSQANNHPLHFLGGHNGKYYMNAQEIMTNNELVEWVLTTNFSN